MNSRLIIIEENQIALNYLDKKLTKLITEHKIFNINDIYLGKVSSVLPSLEAAFVTLNPLGKNGFMQFGDIINSGKEGLDINNRQVKRNDKILVQITKEPTGTKGPSITRDVNLTGNYISILPLGEGINFTRKPHYERDKEYLRAIGSIIKPRGMGISIKSKSIKAKPQLLLKELRLLTNQWICVLKKSKEKKAPCLLSNRKGFITKIMQNLTEQRFDSIVVDSYEGALKVIPIVSKLRTSQNNPTIIFFYKNSNKLVQHYCLDMVISQVVHPRVDMLEGGYIIIEKTEALTTIDVNSGSFTDLPNQRETILWTNYSAAHEILRQLQLRNLGGIIIIDFIDSDNQEDQMKILLYLSKLMKNDIVASSIIQISELGLVEVTRARQGQNVYDAFSRKCNSCNGLGYTLKDLQANFTTNPELVLDLLPELSIHTLERIKMMEL